MKNYSDKSVLISSTSYYNEMHRQLVNLGFPDTQIVDRRLPTAKWPKSTEIEYFGEPFLTLTESEVFIDAGAYDGDTIKSFLKFCNGKYKKICALEPDSHNFIKLKKSIAGYNNIIALNKGAWSSNTILKFTESVDRFGSAITDTGSNLIEAIKIDDTLESDAATFIKMDIEGSELAALMGAAETIKKHKPRLAICVYHKLEDVITIPEYIQSLVPDYKFYIRHYSEIDLGTVLYAI
jgi:FkbM family methyltransferase